MVTLLKNGPDRYALYANDILVCNGVGNPTFTEIMDAAARAGSTRYEIKTMSRDGRDYHRERSNFIHQDYFADLLDAPSWYFD